MGPALSRPTTFEGDPSRTLDDTASGTDRRFLHSDIAEEFGVVPSRTFHVVPTAMDPAKDVPTERELVEQCHSSQVAIFTDADEVAYVADDAAGDLHAAARAGDAVAAGVVGDVNVNDDDDDGDGGRGRGFGAGGPAGGGGGIVLRDAQGKRVGTIECPFPADVETRGVRIWRSDGSVWAVVERSASLFSSADFSVFFPDPSTGTLGRRPAYIVADRGFHTHTFHAHHELLTEGAPAVTVGRPQAGRTYNTDAAAAATAAAALDAAAEKAGGAFGSPRVSPKALLAQEREAEKKRARQRPRQWRLEVFRNTVGIDKSAWVGRLDSPTEVCHSSIAALRREYVEGGRTRRRRREQRMYARGECALTVVAGVDVASMVVVLLLVRAWRGGRHVQWWRRHQQEEAEYILECAARGARDRAWKGERAAIEREAVGVRREAREERWGGLDGETDSDGGGANGTRVGGGRQEGTRDDGAADDDEDDDEDDDARKHRQRMATIKQLVGHGGNITGNADMAKGVRRLDSTGRMSVTQHRDRLGVSKRFNHTASSSMGRQQRANDAGAKGGAGEGGEEEEEEGEREELGRVSPYASPRLLGLLGREKGNTHGIGDEEDERLDQLDKSGIIRYRLFRKESNVGEGNRGEGKEKDKEGEKEGDGDGEWGTAKEWVPGTKIGGETNPKKNKTNKKKKKKAVKKDRSERDADMVQMA